MRFGLSAAAAAFAAPPDEQLHDDSCFCLQTPTVLRDDIDENDDDALCLVTGRDGNGHGRGCGSQDEIGMPTMIIVVRMMTILDLLLLMMTMMFIIMPLMLPTTMMTMDPADLDDYDDGDGAQ